MTPEQLALKRATRRMLHGVGGLEAAAGFCRVGKSVLGDNASANRADSFVAIDVVADLEPLARAQEGWPHVTRALCTAMGGAFVQLPEATATRGDLLALLAAQARESSQITDALCGGLADGKLCAGDAARIIGECDQLLAVVTQMRAELAIIQGEDA